MVFNRETNKSPHGIKAAKKDWGQLMKTVFVKEGSSKSYTNLITSSAALPSEGKKKLSPEPIGQQQLPLGINNVETQTTHRRAKLQLWSVVGLFPGWNLDWFILEQQLTCSDKVHFNVFQSFSIFLEVLLTNLLLSDL